MFEFLDTTAIQIEACTLKAAIARVELCRDIGDPATHRSFITRDGCQAT